MHCKYKDRSFHTVEILAEERTENISAEALVQVVESTDDGGRKRTSRPFVKVQISNRNRTLFVSPRDAKKLYTMLAGVIDKALEKEFEFIAEKEQREREWQERLESSPSSTRKVRRTGKTARTREKVATGQRPGYEQRKTAKAARDREIRQSMQRSK